MIKTMSSQDMDKKKHSIYSKLPSLKSNSQSIKSNSFLKDYSEAIFGKPKRTSDISLLSNLQPNSKTFFLTSCYSINPKKRQNLKDTFFKKKPNKAFTLQNTVIKKNKKHSFSGLISPKNKKSFILKKNTKGFNTPKAKKVAFDLENKNMTSLSIKKDNLTTVVGDIYKQDSLKKVCFLKQEVKREEPSLNDPFKFLKGNMKMNKMLKRSKTIQRKEKNKNWYMFKMNRNLHMKMKTENPRNYFCIN
jgi:hypothetical protein